MDGRKSILISVIIPYKNAEQWIERCADSCQAQGGNFEFLFVNDSSEDNGPELIKKYADDDRFVLLFNDRADGVSGARNVGIDNAEGDWITFLDADDELLPKAYDTYIQAIEEAEAQAELIQLNHLRYYTAIKKQVLKYDNSKGIYDVRHLPECWYGVWNKLIRCDLAERVRFKEGMQYGEDGLFVLECLTHTGRIYHASRYFTTVRHRFDNKESLSHIKTLDDLVKQAYEYTEFMMQQQDTDMRQAAYREIIELWTCDRMRDAVAEERHKI